MKVQGLNIKKLIVLCTAVLGVVIFGIFRLLARSNENSLPYMNVAERWAPDGGFTHMAVYFTPSVSPDGETLKYLHYQIEDGLRQESIEVDGEHPNGRLTASAFIANGSLSVTSPHSSTTMTAMGVWGDFFQFHELELLDGGYFSDNDLNNDYVIIDENAAWKLYGTNDISGKVLYIGDTPVFIRGVFRQPEDKLSTVAGAEGMFCYVPYDFLLNHGMITNISCYEIIMPNPVPNYARQKLEKQLSYGEDSVDIVENTGRFGLINSLKNLSGIRYRAMRTKPLVYPWWENVTRVKADIISVFNLIAMIAAGYAALTAVVLIVILFIQNKDVIAYYFVYLFESIRDSIYRKRIARQREKEQKKQV